MDPINLKAHFDGISIQLDEPFELPLNAKLLVTILPVETAVEIDWTEISSHGLNRAYGNDEPEYSEADLIR